MEPRMTLTIAKRLTRLLELARPPLKHPQGTLDAPTAQMLPRAKNHRSLQKVHAKKKSPRTPRAASLKAGSLIFPIMPPVDSALLCRVAE